MFHSNSVENIAIQRHSKISFVAFTISLITMIVFWCGIHFLVSEGHDQAINASFNSFLAIVLGINFFSISLGIGSLYQSNRKKIFAILGFVSSSILIVPIFIEAIMK